VRVETQNASDGAVTITVSSERLLYGATLEIAGYEPDDSAFCVEPGVPRLVLARPLSAGSEFVGGSLRALNLSDTSPIA
jgi:hypothetical protein